MRIVGQSSGVEINEEDNMSYNTENSKILRADAAARYLGVSASTLAKMRMRGDGPEFMKMGRRLVVYNLSDLTAWLETTRRKTTL
jgi:predicted DNA-binding transcriptional regulator AlpA